jgi:glycosyltransferase involved in cell wall biosynthesis
MEPGVLAVVPVYNGQRFAIKAVKSLLSQDYPNLRIMIVDDGSKDSSAQILKEFSSFPQTVVLTNGKNVGLAQTLNKALERVSNEKFLLVLEQDCELLNSNYITEALKQFDHNDQVAAVSGENSPPEDGELSTIKRIFIHHLSEDVYDKNIIEAGFSLLKADVFRVEVLRKAGGFESSARWKLASEEHIISHKIRSLGYKIIKDPSLRFRAHWDGQENLWQNLKKEAVYGRGLGWALGRMKSDLEVGESRQLRSKRVNRLIQTQYVMLTAFSAFLLLYNPLISLTLLSLATLIYFGYLCYGALVFRGAKERLLFIVSGFLRSWVYIPNFFFGLLYGFMLDCKEKIKTLLPSKANKQ